MMRLLIRLLPVFFLLLSPYNFADTNIAPEALAELSFKPAFNLVQMHKVIEITPAQLPTSTQILINQSIDTLSIYALEKNQLVPIPFQFEEFDHLGFLINNSLAKDKHKSTKGVFDNNDLLVFMLKDTGLQATAAQRRLVDVVSEIKIEDSSVSSYVYLVRNGKISERRYVDYDSNSGLISTPSASINLNPKDLLDWGDVIPTDAVDQQSVLDCFKIRINGKFLAFQLKLNNNNLQARLKKVHEGPVRLTLDAEIRAVVAKAPLLKADAQLHFDSSSARIYIDIDVPEQYSKLIKNPVVLIGVDGNNLYGQNVQTSVTGKNVYRVDGKMDFREKQLNKISVKDPVSWLWLNDENDLSLIGQYDLSSNANFDPKHYPAITIFYLDDDEVIDKPERVRGAVPTLGYRLDGLPASNNVKMSYKVLIIRNLKLLTAGEFLDALDSKPTITLSQ